MGLKDICDEDRATYMDMQRNWLSFWGLLFASGLMLAQQPTAEITGIITDSSGAAVPGAAIDVLNVNTGLHWNASSNGSGNYSFSVLPPGSYQLEIKREGFETRAGPALTSRSAKLPDLISSSTSVAELK
jgi:hypothetical protein